MASSGSRSGSHSALPAAETDHPRRHPRHGREGIDTAIEQPNIFKAVKPKIINCVDTNPRTREPTPAIVDKAAMVLPDTLTIRPEH